MKEHFDQNSRDEFVKYRLVRAIETLQESDCLAKAGHYSGAINRLYYACYYAVSSLLVNNQINASSHVGVRAMFGLKFIKTGLIDISHGKFFNEIFELRHSNDYDDFVFCDEETFTIFRPKAESLIECVSTYLRTRNLTED